MVLTTNTTTTMSTQDDTQQPLVNESESPFQLDPYYHRHCKSWLIHFAPQDFKERGLTEEEMADKMIALLNGLDVQARDNLLALGWPDIYVSTLRTLV